MQIAEIILLNSNSTIYARCNNEKNDKVVVIVNGCLELGAVKKFIPEYNAELCDVIRADRYRLLCGGHYYRYRRFLYRR